ncbi:MAG: hypothetical protein WKG01_23140 [Kofleriaceae bacterium]
MQYFQHNRRRRKPTTTSTQSPLASKVEHVPAADDGDPVVTVTETRSVGAENLEPDASGRYLYLPPTSSRR